MNKYTHHIVKYNSEYEDALLQLEQKSPQGKGIKLEMLRDNFMSRAKVFSKYAMYVGLDESMKNVIGFAGASVAPCIYDNKLIEAGFGFDLKVDPLYRQQGLAKKFGMKVVNDFLAKHYISNYYLTMKSDNTAVAKTVLVVPDKWVTYDFIYLTIPTFKRISLKNYDPVDGTRLFRSVLIDCPDHCQSYKIETSSGMGVWKTYRMYQLKILDMPYYLRAGGWITNAFTAASRRLPVKGDVIRFATLYNATTENIVHLNDVLKILQREKVQYLNVCCTAADHIYKLLSPYAMNKLSYSMLNTFGCVNGKSLSLDVRCL
ncbi:MAG: hypothetical protein HKN92_04180 [Chitinophagales bacterium]|nr:hypothetical protein [Chitinophagales bacterium]